MRVLICGDRNWSDYKTISDYVESLPEGSVVIEGEAQGADRMAGAAAQLAGLTVEKYPAKWAEYGRAAGPIRNKQMMDEGKPDQVHAFHNSIWSSKGTFNMLQQAFHRKIRCFLHTSRWMVEVTDITKIEATARELDAASA